MEDLIFPILILTLALAVPGMIFWELFKLATRKARKFKRKYDRVEEAVKDHIFLHEFKPTTITVASKWLQDYVMERNLAWESVTDPATYHAILMQERNQYVSGALSIHDMVVRIDEDEADFRIA